MNAIRKSGRVCLLTIVLCACVLIEPPRQPVQAQALPLFASVLLKALPSLATVFKSLKPPMNDKQQASVKPIQKDSSAAMNQLKTYAGIEALISKIISAINRSDGSATNSLAAMLTMSGGVFPTIDSDSGKLSDRDKKALGDIEVSLDRMTNHFWPNVTAALDEIANPATKAVEPESFGGDTNAQQAVENILAADKDLKTRISQELKYSTNPNIEKNRWNDLQVDLNALAKVFNDMSRVSANELEDVAEGLTAASTPSPSTPDANDTKKIKAAFDIFSKGYFVNVPQNKGKLLIKLGRFQGVVAEINRQPQG